MRIWPLRSQAHAFFLPTALASILVFTAFSARANETSDASVAAVPMLPMKAPSDALDSKDKTPDFKIMIDPGHGGPDSGAVSGGVREADLVLSIAQQLEKKLSADPRFQVNLTRTSNQKLQLHERVRKAEMAGSEIFISLHANSSPDPRVRGMEVYFQNHLPPDEETLLLAAIENQREMMKEAAKARSENLSKKNDVALIIEDLRRSSRVRSSRRLSLELTKNWSFKEKWEALKTRTVRQAPFHVVTKISIPSVLMELGFMTNKGDREELNRPEVQAKIVDNLYSGIISFATDYKKDLGHSAKQ